MALSPLKRLWDAIKPPPPVPRRASEHASIDRPSWIKRLWRTLKPPPAAGTVEQGISPEVKLHRRRILVRTALVIVAGAAGWEGYVYVSSAPARAEKVYQEGMLLMGKSDFNAAEQKFTRAVDIWPQLASAYLERGLARRDQQKIDEAMQDFDHALSLDSNLAQAHTELGVIYKERGDLQRAVNEFTQSIALASNTDALYQRGQLYAALGQHDKALADYDAAIQEQTDAPFVYRARAMSRDALGDHDGAEEDRTRASQIEHR